jgi:hypothetical protein
MIHFVLIVHMFMPSGEYGYERYPIEAPICKETEEGRVEDSSCGIRFCLAKGRERAAVLWGRHPGTTFGLQCVSSDGSEQATEGAEAGGGHPALNFQ